MNEPQEQEERISPNRTREPVRLLTAEDLLTLDVMQSSSERQMPLRQLVIEGLLSFGEMTSFDFGQLNILVGPNGSGKSNLLDCIRILRYAPFNIQDAFIDSGFEDWLYKGANSQSGIAFLQVIVKVPELPDMILHKIRLGPSLNSRAPLEEVVSSALEVKEQADLFNEQTSQFHEKANPYFVGSYRSVATLSILGPGKRRRERAFDYDPFRSILSQIRDTVQYPEITRLSSLYTNFRIYSEWTFGRNSNLREAASTSRSDPILSESMDDLALVLNSFEKTSTHEKIRVFLRELKETYHDYVTRVLFGRVGIELVEAPFDLPLPARRLSDGTLRFLALAAILLQPNPPPLICLEEPELGMHPDMIRMVARMIIDASTRTQLVITTHSEHLLVALQDDFDVLFAFNAGLTGSLVRRFSKKEHEAWRQEHTLGELWTSGELGGNRW